MSVMVLWIAGILLLLSLGLSITVPHPVTWLITVVLALLLVFVLWPKYQGQQQALQHGQTVQTRLKEIRHWTRKQGDGFLLDQYEIVTEWVHPQNGRHHTFVSPPLQQDPGAYTPNLIAVKVDEAQPEHYVMDLTFLPVKP